MNPNPGVVQGHALTMPEGQSLTIRADIPSALVVMNDDGSTALRVEADGAVTGDLVYRYPEAIPALKELGERIKVVMSRPRWG